MNTIEKDIMKSMVSILNEILNKETPNILTDEQLDARLNDLKELENETRFMYIKSPNYKKELGQCNKTVFNIQNNKKYISIEDIVELSNQKELIVYPDINGVDITITYVGGIVESVQVGSNFNIENIVNMPYRINKNGVYIVIGKVTLEDKPTLYVNDTNGENNIHQNLNEAAQLGFDIVPNWLAAKLNYKKLQSTIEYAIDYVKDEGLSCNEIIFEVNNVEHNKSDKILYVSALTDNIIQKNKI